MFCKQIDKMLDIRHSRLSQRFALNLLGLKSWFVSLINISFFTLTELYHNKTKNERCYFTFLRLFTASTPPNAPPIIIRRNLIAVETVNTFPPVEKAEINTQANKINPLNNPIIKPLLWHSFADKNPANIALNAEMPILTAWIACVGIVFTKTNTNAQMANNAAHRNKPAIQPMTKYFKHLANVLSDVSLLFFI